MPHRIKKVNSANSLKSFIATPVDLPEGENKPKVVWTKEIIKVEKESEILKLIKEINKIQKEIAEAFDRAYYHPEW